MIFSRAELVPPCVCRLYARKKNGWEPMSIADIARAAGMSKSYAQKLSVQTTWRGVTIEKVDAFARACGVDLNRPKVVIAWLQNSGLTPLKRGTGAQKRSFKKIIALRKAA